MPTEEQRIHLANLYGKISTLSRDCSYVQKDGFNQFHRYNYATAANIYEKVNLGLFENRLSSHTQMIIEDIKDGRGKDGKDVLVHVRCILTISDIDTGYSIQTVGLGSGADPGDKAVMKAQTAALKYAWINMLNISTGDDPEADEKTDARAAGKTVKQGREESAPPKKNPPPKEEKDFDQQKYDEADDWMRTHVKDCKCGRPMVCRVVPRPDEADPDHRYYAQCVVIADMFAVSKTPSEKETIRKMQTENHTFSWIQTT
jgi:hypothetical protein